MELKCTEKTLIRFASFSGDLEKWVSHLATVWSLFHKVRAFINVSRQLQLLLVVDIPWVTNWITNQAQRMKTMHLHCKQHAVNKTWHWLRFTYCKLENYCEKKTNALIAIRYNRKKMFSQYFLFQPVANMSYWNSHLFYSTIKLQIVKFSQYRNHF